MSLPSLRLGIDADDTLWPHFGPLLATIGRYLDPPEELREEQWTSFSGEIAALKDKKLRAGAPLRDGTVTRGGEAVERHPQGPGTRAIHEFLLPDSYADVRPYAEAPAAVQAMTEIPGVEAFCVTSHPKSVLVKENDPDRVAMEAHKKRLIGEYFPKLKGVVFTDKKAEQNLDILIDDGLHNIEPFLEKAAQEKHPVLALLVNRTWNRNAEVPGAVRIHNLTEAVPLVARFAEEHFASAQRGRVPLPEIEIPAKQSIAEKL